MATPGGSTAHCKSYICEIYSRTVALQGHVIVFELSRNRKDYKLILSKLHCPIWAAVQTKTELPLGFMEQITNAKSVNLFQLSTIFSVPVIK